MVGAFSPIAVAKPLPALSFSHSSTPRKALSLNSSSENSPHALRVIVKNLSYSTNEASLIKLFSRFGHIIDVQLPRYKETKQLKGYAFIEYGSHEEAILALEDMDHNMINGRVIYVELAKPLHGGFTAFPKASGPPSWQPSASKKSKK